MFHRGKGAKEGQKNIFQGKGRSLYRQWERARRNGKGDITFCEGPGCEETVIRVLRKGES